MNASTPLFWRDPRLPQVELRCISDARQVAYALHSHTHWSLGAVTQGRSSFYYRGDTHPIRAGDLVLMNPGWVHACNPIEHEPWAYMMLYVEVAWVSELRYRAGLSSGPEWQDIATAVLSKPALYRRYRRMATCLRSDKASLDEKRAALTETLLPVLTHLAMTPARSPAHVPAALERLAAYLDDHAQEALTLERLCHVSGYSEGHLIRGFKRHYGMTPRAYLINRRVQLGREWLNQGHSIAETALALGFNDQPHFQRTFKRLLAATPHQYRTPSTSKPSLVQHDEQTAHGQQ
ncbi:helix-turn-helix transcriptional regulator [Halomonas sp. GD1P12]|uniref:helix-turn-helix transcriptional regulator n=1 Tax=Halomonas sp. GD1P12 TaxID=2982691 RepID=UPI0021E4008C|nr:AraC family transcriptional regulator [Halomonas sp. GD1P12]UYG01289.1 AraC family transcriptional regulator [Halomonas sp. GD1P12]